jgi:2-iminobutanoate/2-iminopropanoate deaminase
MSHLGPVVPVYSPVVEAGSWVICSGQLGLRDGKLVDGLGAQVRQAIENLAVVLEGVGLALSDVVKTTVFLTDMSAYAEMNEAYAAGFGACRPARSAVGVAGLPLGALVEIEAWAHRS